VPEKRGPTGTEGGAVVPRPVAVVSGQEPPTAASKPVCYDYKSGRRRAQRGSRELSDVSRTVLQQHGGKAMEVR
jgi:hypothetical protein